MLPIHDQSREYYTKQCDLVLTLLFVSVSQGIVIMNASALLLDSITENLLGLLGFWVGFTAITVIIFLQGIQSAHKDGSQVSIYRIILAVVVLQNFSDLPYTWARHIFTMLFMLSVQGVALLVLDTTYWMASDARDGQGQEVFGYHYGNDYWTSKSTEINEKVPLQVCELELVIVL
ncbi:hypothetical protein EV363DRAFT_1220500 [Boletus edulis]|nr:hypothetical protein EV363DRAFT_1220500 [Boletus edulis]